MENKDCKNKISSFGQKWQKRKQNYKDPTIWWVNGKKFIQGLTKDICTVLKETEKKTFTHLQGKIIINKEKPLKFFYLQEKRKNK